MAIMQLVDKINDAVEKNETTIRVNLDLSNVFDNIDHDILLHTLDFYTYVVNYAPTKKITLFLNLF